MQLIPLAASAANDDRRAQLLRDGYADLHGSQSLRHRRSQRKLLQTLSEDCAELSGRMISMRLCAPAKVLGSLALRTALARPVS